jgi:hypothetical protein
MFNKVFFTIAALWNIGAVFIFGLFTQLLLPIFGMPEKIGSPVWFYQFLGLVLALGIGYFLASRDLKKYAPIVLLGIIGKTLVFVIGLYWFIKGIPDGGVSLEVFLIFCGDLVWAILFIIILWRQAQALKSK